MVIPQYLKEFGKESDKHQSWIESLPYLVNMLSDSWNLILEEPIIKNATCSYVVNCRTKNNEQVILKIGFPHFEASHEIEGLKLLNGIPTVRLLNFDKENNAMLLEKCIPGKSLNTMDRLTQDNIICNLLKDIWNTGWVNESFNSLGEMVALWNRETLKIFNHYPDPQLAVEGCKLKEYLIDTTEEDVLLATDLHAGNVLKSQRRPWLVIDIKPHIGDKVYDLTQHLMNSIERLHARPIETINNLAERANISRTRLKDWTFARLASENNGIYQEIALKIKENIK